MSMSMSTRHIFKVREIMKNSSFSDLIEQRPAFCLFTTKLTQCAMKHSTKNIIALPKHISYNNLTFFFSSTLIALASLRKMALPQSRSLRDVN